jgi:endoglucanase
MARTRGAMVALSLAVLGQSVSTVVYANDAAPSSVLRGRSLYVDPSSAARRQVESWRKSRPVDAQVLEREIASQATAVWIGDWTRDVRGEVSRIVEGAARQQALPVLVAYNIPQRDCGSHSAGGAANADAYRKWIAEFARGISNRNAIVILEPDALASTKCLSAAARAERFALLKHATQTLRAANAFVYIDAGHAQWLSAADAAARLREAGVEHANGFSLNVSNYIGNAENTQYGQAISRLTGGKHFVIDTSRNGMGGNGEWCNAQGRALGTRPTTNTSNALIDAFLWVKKPGESDGRCNGGPNAGQFWAEYALGLAQRSTITMAMAGVSR